MWDVLWCWGIINLRIWVHGSELTTAEWPDYQHSAKLCTVLPSRSSSWVLKSTSDKPTDLQENIWGVWLLPLHSYNTWIFSTKWKSKRQTPVECVLCLSVSKRYPADALPSCQETWECSAGAPQGKKNIGRASGGHQGCPADARMDIGRCLAEFCPIYVQNCPAGTLDIKTAPWSWHRSSGECLKSLQMSRRLPPGPWKCDWGNSRPALFWYC